MKPMLAHTINEEDIQNIKFPVLVSKKLDGCFSGEALVTTNKGLIPIRDIVNNKMNVKALSFNEKTGMLEFKKVVNYFDNGIKSGMTFKGSKATKNHKFYVQGEWIDYADTEYISVLDNGYAQSILIGMLLGDSCPSIEKRYDSYAIRLSWSTSESDYDFGNKKAELFRLVGGVSESKRVSGFGSNMKVFTTSQLNGKGFEFWHTHRLDASDIDNFGKRKKDLNLGDISTNFTDLSLAIWYFDDGTLTFNNGNENTPRIHFSIPRYSEDTQEMFKKLFKHKYGVTPTIASYGRDVKMSFSSADSVYLLYRMARVASGLMPRKFPKDMQFGIIPDPIAPIGLKLEGFERERTEPSSNFRAYDIEVEDNHNYFCNGALVHNCRAVVLDSVVYSRTMKPIRSEAIQRLFGKPEYNNFDGELIYGSASSQDCFNKSTSFCMSRDIPAGMDEKEAKFFVFDYYDTDHSFIDRIDKIITGWPEETQVYKLSQYLVNDAEQLLAYEKQFVDAGFEGLMCKSVNGRYKEGRSTLKEGILGKLKRFSDSECIVLGFEEKLHNTNEAKVNELGYTERSSSKDGLVGAGTLGALLVKDIKTGVEFSIGSGYNDEQRKEIWENQEQWIGQVVKYKYFAVQSSYSKPRFPIYLGIRDQDDM